MKKIILFFTLLHCIALNAQNNETEKRIKQYNISKNHIAIGGYDLVSYFTNKQPSVGLSNLSFNHNGIIYNFSSQSNLELFKKSPNRFEPMYGGWCAYAMGGSGEKVEVDPKTFKILDGKLFLFYNAFFNNTLIKWNKEEANLKLKADKNWNALYK